MMADNDDTEEKEEKDKEKVNDIKNRRPSDRKKKKIDKEIKRNKTDTKYR